MEHTYTRFHPSLATQKGRTMDLNEAKKTAAALFKDVPLEFEKRGLTCRILRPATDADTDPSKETRDGKVVLGAGSSWKAAIRYAARPVLEAQQEREKKRAEKRDADAAEFQLQARRFTDFLYEKFASEFEVYLKQFEPVAAPAEPAAPPEAPADGPPTTPAP